MSNQSSDIDKALTLLDVNDSLVARYYKIAAFLFVGMMLAHALFISRLLWLRQYTGRNEVISFVAFNATLLGIELMLGRITFMLAGRAGQLRDLKLIFTAMGPTLNPDTFERLSKGVMMLRRDQASSLKLIDVERLALALRGGKH